MYNSNDSTKWAQLLDDAVKTPGKMLSAYQAFWNYSSGNQLLAMLQLSERGIPLGPIASFNAWKEKGRFVKKGSKAVSLCMPVTCKRKDESGTTTEGTDGKPAVFTRFVFRNNWFALDQTDGEPYTPPAVPSWDRSRALAGLEVTEIPFEHLNGNCQGFAKGRSIAINPLAGFPVKTTFHELGHILLGHTAESEFSDSETTPRSLKEIEAEAVALLCLESLGLPGSEFCRGYIQNWGSEIPERSAQKIFSVADKIIKAGREQSEIQTSETN